MILPQSSGELPLSSLPDSSSVGAEPSVRIRLLECRLERRPSAISRVIVEFSGPGADERFSCLREDTASPAGDLRLASLATLDAVMRATRGALRLELIGAKPIRAFDTNIVVVAALAHHEGGVTRIIGSAIAEDDLLLATSRATLAAVNRLASPLLARLLPFV
jgi:hypothetical protein